MVALRGEKDRLVSAMTSLLYTEGMCDVPAEIVQQDKQLIILQ